MPRSPRFLLHKSYYHIMTRGNNRNIVFRQDEDYRYFIELIKRFKKELPFNLYHYCLMPNHTHFLIQTNKAEDFSLMMKKLNLSYFFYYKKKYGWIGHFWQDRFKSQPVGKDDYFIQCGKYIELNPTRARIVDKPDEYLYSSFNYYAFGKIDSLLTEDFIYHGLSKDITKRQKIYKELVIGNEIADSYKKKEWGSGYQRYNEAKKIKYHQLKK